METFYSKTKKRERDLQGVFVSLGLAELADDTVELILAHCVAFFFPFPYGNDGATFSVHQAKKPTAQRVSAATGIFCCGGVARCYGIHRRRFRREVAGVTKG